MFSLILLKFTVRLIYCGSKQDELTVGSPRAKEVRYTWARSSTVEQKPFKLWVDSSILSGLTNFIVFGLDQLSVLETKLVKYRVRLEE